VIPTNKLENTIIHTSIEQSLQQLVISCCTSGRGSLVFGDEQGYINLLDRDFSAKAFQAHKHIQFVQQLKQRSILVSLGSEDDNLSNTVKVWDMEREEKTGNPLCLKTITLNTNSRVPVCIFLP
jgi:vacuolar protein sorting-associated protein 11